MVEDSTKKRRLSVATNRSRAREMRHHPVSAEKLFWSCVRNRQLGGFKFKRQVPVGPYIADFICMECSCIVELDGPLHAGRKGYDEARDKYLKNEGFEVMRIANDDLGGALAATMKMIEFALIARKRTPSPPQGERAG